MKDWPLADVKKMTTRKLREELTMRDAAFIEMRKTAEGGGSPGEWIVERMDELQTEIKRRRKAKCT